MYYKHSGQFSIVGLAVAGVMGFAAALIAGYAYGWGIIYIPDARLAAFATIAFACLVGAATGYGLVWGKVRNEPLSTGFAGGVSLLALYVSWAVWVAKTLESQHVQSISWVDAAAQPAALWNMICTINHYGTWGLSSGSVTNGWELWVIWLVEAGIIIGGGVLMGLGVLNSHPFCENCGIWCRRAAKFQLAAPGNLAQLKLELEANNFSTLEKLGPANKAADHLIVDMDSCERCRQFHTISINRVVIERLKSGKYRTHNRTFLRHLLVGPGQAEMLRGIAQRVTPAATPKALGASVGKR